MQITPRVAVEVASHEDVVREAYRDSVGVLTWSVGLTNATGHRVERYVGNPATLNKCLSVYLWALENYAEAVRAEFAGHDLTEAQFAAALSFHWNTGAIRSASWPDHWKAGDVDRARESFMSWRKPPEIIPRREKERDLFFDGVWSNRDQLVEWTRVRSNGSIDWTQRKVHPNAEALMRSAMEVIFPPAEEPAPEVAPPPGKPEAPAEPGSISVPRTDLTLLRSQIDATTERARIARATLDRIMEGLA